VHAPTEDKGDDKKGSFYTGLECTFEKLPKYPRRKLGHFKAKLGTEDIFRTTMRNGSLQQISHDNEFCHFKKSDSQEYNVPTSQRS
jgi:hypothetical protein